MQSSPGPYGAMIDDRFTVHRVLGFGGTATVYLADDALTGRLCALKVLLPELARRPALRHRFAQEASTMASLSHPAILRVLAWGVGELGPYLATEYAEGGSVGAFVRHRGPMAPAYAVGVALQTCIGVTAAHARGIVHRDVKPDNVLIMQDGSCRVADFGIARITEPSGPQVTQAGSTLGTAGFMAPEQMQGAGEVDPRADIYGIATTLWFLLLGDVPANAFAEDPWMAGIPGPLIPILARATAYRPRDRQVDVAELMRELHQALRRLPAPGSEPCWLGSLPDRPAVDSAPIGPSRATPTWVDE